MTAASARGNSVFSSEVCLTLESSGCDILLSTVEPGRFVLVQPQQLHAEDAVLIVTVNGVPRRTAIRVVAALQPAREFAYSVR